MVMAFFLAMLTMLTLATFRSSSDLGDRKPIAQVRDRSLPGGQSLGGILSPVVIQTIPRGYGVGRKHPSSFCRHGLGFVV